MNSGCINETKGLSVINLDQFKDCFKDSAAFLLFGRQFSEAIQFDLRPIMFNGQVIGSSLSKDATKDVLADRIFKAIERRPELVDELAKRLDMPIVE